MAYIVNFRDELPALRTSTLMGPLSDFGAVIVIPENPID
jgi:hypothetical protein